MMDLSLFELHKRLSKHFQRLISPVLGLNSPLIPVVVVTIVPFVCKAPVSALFHTSTQPNRLTAIEDLDVFI